MGMTVNLVDDNNITVEVTPQAPVEITIDRGLIGPQGPQGDTGATGATGATGETGPGVAIGGTTGQILVKASNINYNTQWSSLNAGYGINVANVSGSITITSNITYGTAAPSGGNNGDIYLQYS